MRFTYHIGMHCTDEDRALTCLLRNARGLARRGTVVAAPDRFRPALREAMLALKGAPAPADMQERLLDAVIDTDTVDHVMFSSGSFLCIPARAISGGTLYPLVAERAPWIRNLFPDSPAHFCVALRNPASFIPALQNRFSAEETFDAFLARIDPEALSWSDMVARLRQAVPDAEITVWCNEDAPLLWSDILETLSGQPDASAFEGADAFLAELMLPEGLTRMRTYLEAHPPRGPAHRRRVIAAFLDKFAQPDAVQESFDLPGWTADRLAHLTAAYEADIARLSRMEGVRLLAP